MGVEPGPNRAVIFSNATGGISLGGSRMVFMGGESHLLGQGAGMSYPWEGQAIDTHLALAAIM